jgi:hypothetical protein
VVSIVRTGKPANELPEAVRSCLGAAEAQAARHWGDAPVALWRPRSRRRRWLACIAVVLTCAIGAWRLGVDERVGAPVVVVVEPATQLAVMDRAGARPDAVEATDARTHKRETTTPGAFAPAAAAQPARLPPAVDPSQASVVDADAWALHPEPRPTAVPPPESFTGLVNVPDVPDEHDATPGEDTLPEGEPVIEE